MLERLKTLNVDRPDIEELIELHSGAKAMLESYSDVGVDAPKWLGNRLDEINAEIQHRNLAARKKRIAEIDARLTSLETAEEKRARLTAERDELTGNAKSATS